MKRSHPRRLAAAGAALPAVLLLAGCSGSGPAPASLLATSAPPSGRPASVLPPPAPQGKQPVVATVKPKQFPKVTIDVNAAERDANGLLVVVFTVTNHGTDDFDLQNNAIAGLGTNPYTFSGQAGITIIDHAAKQRYYPVSDDSVPNHCLCRHGNDNSSDSVAPGASQIVWDVYGPNPMPSSIEIDIPGYAPLTGVPVRG